jgi:hypothetical protein
MKCMIKACTPIRYKGAKGKKEFHLLSRGTGGLLRNESEEGEADSEERVSTNETFAVQYYAWINFVPDCN